jgi:hypothetical protein
MSEFNINVPQSGMNFANPSTLKEGQFSLILNGILQSVDGNFLMASNDHSNILLTRFKDGYKVIGTFVVPALSVTFLFLTNPATSDSEIGFIFDTNSPDKPDITGANGKILEQDPLETRVQTPISQYYTFVNAKCLNFDIDHPVSSWVKIDDCNVRIYFNDFKNPPRYINYKDFQKIDISNCPLIETDQLDCDKIQIFPESCYPKVEVIDVVSGGQNKAGVYQFAVCYSDVNSNKITDYFYVTNPTPLFDQPITVNTDYTVYKSFKLEITNLNTDFKYFNLVVLKTINNVTTPQLVETFEVNSSNFTYVYTGVDKNIQQDLALDEILVKRPLYNKAKLTTESNGYLILTSLEEPRILNLQPVVKDIPLYWQTVEMNEGDYSNPIIAQNNVGYLGDETYAFGISFTYRTGKQSNVFAFVNREATPYDLEDVGTISGKPNPDVIGSSVCDTTNPPSGRWEVYNTAESKDIVVCIDEVTEGATVQTIVDNIDCLSDIILYKDVPNPEFPTFYFNLPQGTQYPPTNKDEAEFIINWVNNIDNGLPDLATDPVKQSAINLCDCDSFLPSFPPGAIALPADPIIIDLTNPDSSVETIEEPTTFDINTYALLPPSEANDKLIKPTGAPPSAPDPCKNYAGDNNDDETKGFLAWIDAKQNNTFSGAETLAQSVNDRCAQDTYGAFIGNGGGYTESWYQFYASNKDGVAAILLSTDRGSCRGNSNNSDIEVFKTDQFGNPGMSLSPLQKQVSVNGNGIYVLLEGLTPSHLYYIKVTGGYDNPTGLARECCKNRSFKICVTSPKPQDTISYQIPGTARIIKTCNIQYEGVPENSCKPKADEYGIFAYWKSQETYPCNEQVWRELAGQPIRHFKFPDHKVKPFFKSVPGAANSLSLQINKIYPKGIRVNIEDIKFALEKAVAEGLITFEEQLQICGYRIYRSNRRGNQSIIAKGLIYDVWEYKDNIYDTGNKVLFPNFPYNDNRTNEFIKTKPLRNKAAVDSSDYLPHPFSGTQNNKYTFDSPNTSFNNPGLGTELKLECEQYGISIGNYNELKNNANYQYIGAGIISAAVGFAGLETAFESISTVINATLTLNLEIFGSGSSIPLGLILALIGENLVAPVRLYSHYAEWFEIIKKFAPFRNYGVTYSSVGVYNQNKNEVEGNIRRTIANAQYTKQGIINVKTTRGNTRFNNFKRESSVFIELADNSFFNSTTEIDNSRVLPECDKSNGIKTNIASHYASLKNQNLSQYGQIDNIQWIDTGYNGVIDWTNPNQDTSCDTIFGGDTFINRFTKKRKVPMFMDDRVVPSSATQLSPLNLDIQMSLLSNIGYSRYFMNFPTTFDYTGIEGGLFGDVAVVNKNRADYNFYCFSSSGQSWKDAGLATAIIGGIAAGAIGVISLPIAIGVASGLVKRDLGNDLFLNGRYIHSFYGIISFLCESDYNLDYRHGENFREKDFYPNVGDTNEWTQEYNVPMSFDNFYYYNRDYSKQNNENPNFVLNNDFKQTKEDCKISHPNRLIYSLQDNDQNDKFDGNLIFLANNYYDFPKSGGKVNIVKGLQNGKVLVVQENQSSVFNSFISLETNIATSAVGSNTIFNSSIPAQYIKTDLGYGGSQTNACITTEFGTYWVDNKRGQIISLGDGISNIIQPQEEWWFKQNLPFQILNDFPDFDITNNFKYVGMAITYDARYKRIIFTKRDVELKPEYKGHVTYDGNLFYLGDNTFTVENDKYFCNKSWTISYNPLLKSFVSFHSFVPNYYIPNQAYFSSGINYSFNSFSEEYGLWGHNLTNQSYQVYYGKINPYILEYSVPTKYQNKQLESIRYVTEFYRFQDNISSGLIPEKTFNKAIVYNQKQSSGLLELILKEKNNRQQSYQYSSGKQNQNSRSILVEKVNNEWSFNNFYNVAIYNSGQPLMQFSCDNIAYKNLNPEAISYKPQYIKEKMVSDYHIVRLINDKYSNYHILNRFFITRTQNYDS